MFIISPIVKTLLKIATLIFYAITAICAFGGYISPHIFAMPSVLVLVFPYMLAASIVLIVAWICFKSWITAAAGVLMIIICWAPASTQMPMHSSAKPTPGATTFTLLTWNVAHGKDFTNPEYEGNRTFETILAKDADIVCLQEMKNFSQKLIPNMSPALYDSVCRKYPYREKYEAHDVMFFSKFPFIRLPQAEDHYYPNARFARFNINGNKFLLCNVHLTSYKLDDNEQSIISSIRSPEGIENSLKNFKNDIYTKLKVSFPIRANVAKNLIWNIREYRGPVIVCGDFNDVPASWTYRLFIKDGFEDAYTQTNILSVPTFYNHLLYFHIDQILYRGMIKPLKVDRINVKSSDHYGLVAEFEFL